MCKIALEHTIKLKRGIGRVELSYGLKLLTVNSLGFKSCYASDAYEVSVSHAELRYVPNREAWVLVHYYLVI